MTFFWFNLQHSTINIATLNMLSSRCPPIVGRVPRSNAFWMKCLSACRTLNLRATVVPCYFILLHCLTVCKLVRSFRVIRYDSFICSSQVMLIDRLTIVTYQRCKGPMWRWKALFRCVPWLSMACGTATEVDVFEWLDWQWLAWVCIAMHLLKFICIVDLGEECKLPPLYHLSF